MSFRVIHHEGDKNLLIEKIKASADQLKNDEYKDGFDFDEGEWERAVDSVANNDFSDPELASLVLNHTINTYFPPISEDCGIHAYQALADKTSGKLAKTLRMFVDGRNFSTGNAGFGFADEINCGYLTPDEVKEFLGLLKAYTPDSTAVSTDMGDKQIAHPNYARTRIITFSTEDENQFVEELINTFSRLVEKNSGDLFIMC